MPISLICDDTISMLIKIYDKDSSIDLVYMFVQKLFSFVNPQFCHYIALYDRNEGTVSTYRKDYKAVLDQFDNLVKNFKATVHGDFRYAEAVKFCDDEMKRIWGSDNPNIIIILTDGGKRLSYYPEECDLIELDDEFRSIVHTISFTADMSEVLKNFSLQTGGVSLTSKREWKETLNSEEIVDKLVSQFRENSPHLGFSTANINFGHMHVKVKLFPFVDLLYSNDKKYCFEMNKKVDVRHLFVDIFGFISLADLNYPCSISDHLIVYDAVCGIDQNDLEQTQSALYFAQLLNTGLINTKCAAMCRISWIDNLTTRYGFIRNIIVSDTKYTLKLCLIPKDYIGFPWIGKFSDLVPQSDNPDVSYNPETKSPFPIKVREDCSYKLSTEESYHYTTWISSSTALISDFVKVVRICKRLPERKHVFLKEVNRFRETALGMGSRSLITYLCIMLQREGGSNLNLDSQAILRYVVESLTNNPYECLVDNK